MFEILDPNSAKRVPPNLCALGIMTKAPQPGKVKTRLSPPLTPEEAAQLNACFLQDLSTSILQASKTSSGRGVVVYTPIGAENVYEKILPADFLLIPQRGDGFGERLIFAAEDLFAVGFESICLINSDSPTVPASSFSEAVNELSRPGDRVVLGPSHDGGYYLIGLKQLQRRLFQEIDWSTERVFEQTRQRAGELGLTVHELAPGLDVDDALSLGQLCDEILNSNEPVDVAENTTRFLKTLIDTEGRNRIWPASL